MTNKIKTLNNAIEEIERQISEETEITYKKLKEIINNLKEVDKADYCILKKWLEDNFKNKGVINKDTFGANFIDLIRAGFFFSNKNLMGTFAENVIGDIADCERKKICNEIMCNQYKLSPECEKGKCLDLIKNKIGDPFLKDNLLYFKKKDAENGDRGDSGTY